MRKAVAGDFVLLDDGHEWTVTDAAQFDDLLRVENKYGSQIVRQAQVEWNYTAVKDADVFDPDLFQDYN